MGRPVRGSIVFFALFLVLLLGKQKKNKKQNEEKPQLTTLAFSIRYCLKRSSIAIACK
jgi:hypothetical protein